MSGSTGTVWPTEPLLGISWSAAATSAPSPRKATVFWASSADIVACPMMAAVTQTLCRPRALAMASKVSPRSRFRSKSLWVASVRIITITFPGEYTRVAFHRKNGASCAAAGLWVLHSEKPIERIERGAGSFGRSLFSPAAPSAIITREDRNDFRTGERHEDIHRILDAEHSEQDGFSEHHVTSAASGPEERRSGRPGPVQFHAHHRQRLHQRRRSRTASRLRPVAGTAGSLQPGSECVPPQSHWRGQRGRPPEAADHGSGSRGRHHERQARFRSLGADLLR